MKKLLTGGGVLLILSFLSTIANASPNKPLSVLHFSPTNDLSQRLADDRNFQDLAVHSIQFLAKIQSVKSINFFEKIAAGIAIENVANNEFLKLSGFSSVAEISAGFTKLHNLSKAVFLTFPEIGNGSLKNNEIATALVLLEKNETIRNQLMVKGKLPAELCWQLWVLCMNSCWILYYNNPDAYNSCWAGCSSGAGWCFLFAD